MSANTVGIYSPNLVQSQQVVRSVLGALASAGGVLWHFAQHEQVGGIAAASAAEKTVPDSLAAAAPARYRGGMHK